MELVVVATHDNATNENDAKMLRLACTHLENGGPRAVRYAVQKKAYVGRESASIASKWWWWWIGIDVAATERHFYYSCCRRYKLHSVTFTLICSAPLSFALCAHVQCTQHTRTSLELITSTSQKQKQNRTPNRDVLSVVALRTLQTCMRDCAWCNFMHWHCRL